MRAKPLVVPSRWLCRLGVNDALVGDLIEQCQAGRSCVWLCRQVIATIILSVAKDIRDDKLLALRSMMITWAILIPWVESTWALYLWTSHKWADAWVNSSVVLFEFWILFGGGLCLVWCLGSAVSGWISAQVSRQPRIGIVVASALAQMPLSLWWSRSVWLHVDAVARTSARIAVPNLIWAAVVLVGIPIGTLLGGLWDTISSPNDVTTVPAQ
jgi:hypothetical protein